MGKVAQAGFQPEVQEWMLACFGPEIAADQLERADRFTEEALELAQTMPGFSAERAHSLVDYVFGRPIGERGQEVGGVMVTLAALCNPVGISIEDEAERELSRVWTKVEAIRAKQAAKPVGSALPMATTRTNNHAELVEALREIAEAMEYAAGCDEGVGEDAAASEVMSWAGSPMAVAYTRARSLVSLYGEGGK